MKMRIIVNYIKTSGCRNGYEVSDYARNVLGYPDKSAGGCLARAIEQALITIAGTTRINGKKYNIYV